jgi:Secretion system C-terminal sorting domain
MSSKIFLMVIILNGLVSNILPQTLFRSGLYLHHSVGGVIWSNSTPDIPQLMYEYNVEHNYTGNQTVTMNLGESFFPPVREFSDNHWDTWHAVFVGQSPYPEDVDSLQSYIANNPIIVIETGFAGTDPLSMGDPADTLTIEDYSFGRTYYRTQWHWRSIIRAMQSYPDNFFVIWTGIPLVPGPNFDKTLTHHFVKWAKDTLAAGNDPVFGDFPDNVYVFDSWLPLAIAEQVTQWGTAYWGMNPLYHDEGDNHPNEAGANVVAQPFVWETFDAAIAYEEVVLEVDFNPTTTYTLEQNYPNPFNPNTKIKYSVSQSSNILIRVFDILGNDIVTLVNTEKPIGSYEVEFDASKLPSGIYFYQLKAGSFVQTKKMVLLK